MTNEAKHELRRYSIGLILSAALTVLAFWAAMSGALARGGALWLIGAAGVVQVGVQLRCFLHLGFRNQNREDLQLIIFSLVMLTVMVGGTLWIMASLGPRMH